MLKLWTGEQQGILEWPVFVEKTSGFVSVVKTTVEIEMVIKRPCQQCLRVFEIRRQYGGGVKELNILSVLKVKPLGLDDGIGGVGN